MVEQPGSVVQVPCRVVRWVGDEPWPGWVEVSVVDADGQDWRFQDKAPIFDPASALSRDTTYPVELTADATVVGESIDDEGREIVTVRLTGWGYDEDEYRFSRAQLAPTPWSEQVEAIERRRRTLPAVQDIQRELVSDLRYEDDQWLWEVVWSLNARHPDVALAAKVQAAKAAVRGLLGQGTIELWRADGWPPTSFMPLNADETAALFEDDVAWHDPATARVIVEIREP